MTDSATSELPAFPMQRGCPFDPPDGYAKLRKEEPISRVMLPTGKTAWAVAGHSDVRALLANPNLSVRRDLPGFPFIADLPDLPEDSDEGFGPSLLGVDPPDHTRMRRPVITEFTVRRIQAMRPKIQQTVDTHIDAMLAGDKPADLVAALAMPVPSLVICDLLGVPYSDHDFFQERSGAILDMSSTPQERVTAANDLARYMDTLVTAAEKDPGEDLIGRLIVKNREAGIYDHGETVDLAQLLLLAGHETTANMISLGTAALLEKPEQLAELAKDPSLWPSAIEELLRYFTIADFVPSRVALADIEISGVTIAAGDGVILLTASADRDAEVFDDPDNINIHRGTRNHVAFGYGVHQCIGQNLARLELEIVYRTLFERIPTLRLVGERDALSYKSDSLVYGLHALPVTW